MNIIGYAAISIVLVVTVAITYRSTSWPDVWAILRGNRYEDLPSLTNGRRPR